ncbi:MAG: hypothetical protein DI629_19200 [Mesorhizobium amorphae]|nr:MAG: hypothetical protein DI629_19200 [Mesorhizobium amorphae]
MRFLAGSGSPADHFLPPGYRARAAQRGEVGGAAARGGQPEVGDLAAYLARITGRRKTSTIAWGEWSEADLSSARGADLVRLADEETIVVCADVVQRLAEPARLLEMLGRCYQAGAIVLTATSDRLRSHGAHHGGPPPDPSHTREWALPEYRRFLESRGLACTYAGYTICGDGARSNTAIVSVHHRAVEDARQVAPALPRPLAIIAAYNEADVIGEAVEDLIEQGCDVHVLDNQSTDGTADILRSLASRHEGRLGTEVFPGNEHRAGDLHAILSRKEEIAQRNPGRWILHTDADDIRRSCFKGTNFARALEIARHCGANRVGYTMINFRPMAGDDPPDNSMRSFYRRFQFGDKPGHFLKVATWFQGTEKVDLAGSGGHSVTFGGMRDFPYKLLLHHYPLRSAAHARRKIFVDREERWAAERATRGWHTHYDGLVPGDAFAWDEASTHGYDENFWDEFGLAVISDILERRRAAGHPY